MKKTMLYSGWWIEDYGLCYKGDGILYEIQKEDLFETRIVGKKKVWNFPFHMSEKIWVKINDFNRSFEKAIEIFKKFRPIDTKNISMKVTIHELDLYKKRKKAFHKKMWKINEPD